jgi:hypothetical protein
VSFDRAPYHEALARLGGMSEEERAEWQARGQLIAEWMPRVLPASWREDHKVISPKMAVYMHRRAPLVVLLSCTRYRDERRWLHASVSHENRLPNWEDLREVKDVFIGRDKRALQVLPAAEEYVNIHPRVLHLWHCVDGDGLPDFRVGGAI